VTFCAPPFHRSGTLFEYSVRQSRSNVEDNLHLYSNKKIVFWYTLCGGVKITSDVTILLSAVVYICFRNNHWDDDPLLIYTCAPEDETLIESKLAV
jgi:hypothetical protein